METADLVLPIIFAMEVTEKPALRRSQTRSYVSEICSQQLFKRTAKLL